MRGKEENVTNGVKVDVFNIFSFRKAAKSADVYQQRMREFVEEVQIADKLGYNTYWFAEHHFQKEGWEIVPNPLVLISHIAALTKRIRLGTAVVILPQWHPIRLAEDVAMVDHLSGGRLDLGIGRGYNPRELDGFGVPLNEEGNRALFEEVLSAAKKAWTEEEFHYEGSRYRIPAGDGPEPTLTVMPSPLQKPYPPLWQAIYSPATAKFAARNRIKALFNFASEGYLANVISVYRDAAKEAGWEPGHDDVCAGSATYVADSDEQARADMESYLMGFGEFFGGLGFNAVVARPGEPVIPASEITYEYLAERAVNFGSPDTVRDRVNSLIKATGTNRYLLFLLGEDHELRVRCLERFAKEVWPELIPVKGAGAMAT